MTSTVHLSATLLAFCALYMTSSATVLTVQSPCPNNFFYDAVYDLQSSTVCPSPYVTEYKPITLGSGCECCSRGTLNITMNNNDRKALLVDLWIEPSLITNQWTFNLGDSKTNNGYKGDGASTSYDAEIHTKGDNGFYIWSSDKGTAAGEPNRIDVDNVYGKRVTFVISAGKVQWVSDSAMDFLQQSGLFTFNGPDDTEKGGNADHSVYLGLNQVVNGQTSRRGQGLCKAAVRFLCERRKQPTTPTKETAKPATPTKQIVKSTISIKGKQQKFRFERRGRF